MSETGLLEQVPTGSTPPNDLVQTPLTALSQSRTSSPTGSLNGLPAGDAALTNFQVLETGSTSRCIANELKRPVMTAAPGWETGRNAAGRHG